MRAGTDIQNDLGFSDQDMGLVFSAFLLGYLLLEMPGGWMGDKWGPRRVLTRIVIAWSIFTALTGSVGNFSFETGIPWPWLRTGTLVFDSLALMLLIRFLFGVGEAGAYPNLNRLTRDWFPIRERAFSIGAIWTAARIGGAIAPFVIGRLTAVVGWRMAFFILGAIGLVWVVAFRRWFTDRPDQHPSCNLAEQRLIEPAGVASVRGIGHSWPPLRLLAGSLTIWALCFSSFWVCLGWYFFPTWQPKYLQNVHGFASDGMKSELLTGLPFLFGAVGSLSGGKLSDSLIGLTGSRRWGRALVGLIGFTGAGVCFLLTGWVGEWWLAVGLLCLASLLNDLAIPPLWAACGEVGGRYAGSVSGLMNMVGGFGAVLSPAYLPRVRDRLRETFTEHQSWHWIFIGLAAAWFLAAAAWLVIDATKVLGGEDSDQSPPDRNPSPLSSLTQVEGGGGEGVQRAPDAEPLTSDPSPLRTGERGTR
jgi:MFS family permease